MPKSSAHMLQVLTIYLLAVVEAEEVAEAHTLIVMELAALEEAVEDMLRKGQSKFPQECN